MKRVIFKPENIFLIFCLLWGMVILCVMPPFQSPDEPEHFFKMWGYTQGTYRYQIKDNQAGLNMPQSMASLYQFYNFYRFSNKKIPYKATLQSFNIPLAKKTTTFLKHTPSSYTPVSYFPSFIILWIMKLLNFGPLFMMYILRFCSLLVYLALAYFSIKITPCKKWLFCFFALLPVCVTQAASISTDGITTGVIMFYIAYTLKIACADSEKKISNRQIFIWSGLITVINILKFAYFPLILLYFLIPAKKFESFKNYLKCFILTLLVNIVVFVLFMFTLFSVSSSATYGLGNINKFVLIKEILFSPFSYVKNILASTIFLKGFLYQNTISSIGVTLAMIPVKYTHLAWTGLVGSVFYIDKKEQNCAIELKNKAWILIAVILTYILIMTSVYLIYQTKPYIIGVQGRYLTPLIPVVLLLLVSKHFVTESKVIPAGLFLISQCLLFQNLMTLILRYY